MDSNQETPSLPSMWPVSLDDWPVSTEDDAELLGLNAFLVVLRHVYTLAPSRIRGFSDPQDHAVLRIARILSAEKDAIQQGKAEALRRVLRSSRGMISCLQLVMSDDILRSVWSYAEFLLFSPYSLSWDEHTLQWKQCTATYDSTTIARGSLITYDGKTRIA